MSKVKPSLLFICHRIPFPPNKGDKIATFNIMKYLNEYFELYLASFIDDEYDRQYQQEVKAYCKDAKFVDICAQGQLKSGINSLLKGVPVSVAHYLSEEMQSLVDELVEQHDIDNLLVYSSGVAQFIDHDRYKNKTRFLNMTDIDSDKWRQYAENKPLLTSWIYRREHRLLQDIEQDYLNKFDGVSLVTEDESKMFKTLSPSALHDKICTVTNGVDTEYFDPEAKFDYTDKPDNKGPMVCFTGAMDYWANVDAVVWFCEKVWPIVRQSIADAEFYIVGSKPTEKVKKLSQIDGITVTGRVVDVRPYIEASKACVGPLRIARGIQNKMLEAMSMAKPVVMTTMAAEGIKLNSDIEYYIKDEPEQYAAQLLELLRSDDLAKRVGQQNRDWVVQNYSWNSALAPLAAVFSAPTE